MFYKAGLGEEISVVGGGSALEFLQSWKIRDDAAYIKLALAVRLL